MRNYQTLWCDNCHMKFKDDFVKWKYREECCMDCDVLCNQCFEQRESDKTYCRLF